MEEEAAAAQRLIHELGAGVDRQVLFRFHVAGEDKERICADLGLDPAHAERILARAEQRFREIAGAADLRRGLLQVAARQAAGEQIVRGGLAGWLRASWRSRLALLLLLAALGAAAFLGWRTHGLRKDLTRVYSAAAPAQPAATPAQALEAQLRQTRHELDEAQEKTAQRLDWERRRHAELTAELDREHNPQINLPLVPLAPLGHAAAPGPPAQVALPHSPTWIILSLDLSAGKAPAAPLYKVDLVGPRGGERWSGAGLTRNRWGALVLGLPSRMLRPGTYQLRVETVPLQGEPAPAGRFAFEIVR
jgi:hypothetical protein